MGKGRDRMWNRLKIVLVITAMCTGISIIFLEAVFIGSGMWSVRLAARREPVALFSGSCDVSQLEEMDVVCGTIYELCGRYDYTYDDYVSDIAYYYVLPIDTAGTVCKCVILTLTHPEEKSLHKNGFSLRIRIR